jgi:hypothetical protein
MSSSAVREPAAASARRRWTVLLSGLALVTLSGVLAAPQAAASTGDCQSWPNPASATGAWTVHTVPLNTGYTSPLNRRRVELRVGNLDGVQQGWTRIAGYTKPGDQYWMDVTRNGGASWTQCGPFQIHTAGMTPWTPAHATSPDPDTRFRACGRAVGEGSYCGPWW